MIWLIERTTQYAIPATISNGYTATGTSLACVWRTSLPSEAHASQASLSRRTAAVRSRASRLRVAA